MTPRLRRDLILTPVEPDRDGEPLFVLQDPLAGRYFRLSRVEAELLRGPLDDPAAAAARAGHALGRGIGVDLVKAFLAFLQRHDLLIVQGAEAQRALIAKHQQSRGDPLRRLIRGYLFFRLPLWRPGAALAHPPGWVAWLLTPAAVWWALGLAALGLALALRRWEAYLGDFPYLFSWRGALSSLAVMFGVKILHEFAHAYTAATRGARVFSMGIAFIAFWPVFYTDATDAWRLPRRQDRLAIAAAGIRFELMLAGAALFLWSFLPEGPLRTAAFLLSSSTWIATLAINLNPLMKFDGYFIFTDWIGEENLQDRALALWAWRRRRSLWGFDEPPPEPPQRWLYGYAALIWVYRFWLTLAIAWLIYGYVFKALGLILLTLQVSLFGLHPMMKELGEVWRRRRAAAPAKARRTLLIAGALLALAATPLPYGIEAPALNAPRIETLYAPADGYVLVPPPPSGGAIAAEAAVLTLTAPELAHQIDEARRALETLRWQVSVMGFEAKMAGQGQVLEADLHATALKLQGLTARAAGLTLKAPFAGEIGEQALGLVKGAPVGGGDALAAVVDPHSRRFYAYVPEQALSRLSVGATGRFYFADDLRAPLRVRVTEIDAAALRELDVAAVASPQGGPVAARPAAEGRFVPVEAVYRVALALRDDADAPRLRGLELGRVTLRGASESLVVAAWRRVSLALRRELAF